MKELEKWVLSNPSRLYLWHKHFLKRKGMIIIWENQQDFLNTSA